MELIGKGMTADVVKINDQYVEKRFKTIWSQEAIEYEANTASTISGLAINAPKCFGLTDDNRSIVYEYIEGNLFQNEMLRDFKKHKILIKKFVLKQKEINLLTSEDLKLEKTKFSEKLANLDFPYKKLILKHVALLPDSKSVCHGDFHFRNIIINNNDLTPIDWNGCYRGNPIGDIIRSYLIINSPNIGFPVNLINFLKIKIVKKFISNLYVKEVNNSYNLSKEEFNKYLPIIAAVKLADNILVEKKYLNKIIRRNIKHLPHCST